MELVDPSMTNEEAITFLQSCLRGGISDIVDPILKMHFAEAKLSDFPRQCIELLTFVAKQGSSDLLLRLLAHVDDKFLATPFYNQTLVTKLLAIAVTSGNYSLCGALLERGGNPNGQLNGTTILHTAVSQKQEHLLKTFADGGADLTQRDKKGENLIFTVIMSAIQNKIDLVSWLVSREVDPQNLGASGKQPIHVAAAHAADVIPRLLELGCDVNQPDVIHRDTPLHIACCRCNENGIEILVKCGAQINLLNNDGETPLTKLLKYATNTVDFHSKLRIKLARQLIKHGFVCRSTDSTRALKQRVGRNKVIELYQRLQREPRPVSSLQHMSRLKIRENITPAVDRRAVLSLDVPRHLKNYLMFTDFRFS